ncbi:MAG: carboxymuconolactone decarboxylase family protein [Acidimicrobiales bacterium]
MANVALVERPRGLIGRAAWRYSKKTFGKVPEPTRAVVHHSGVAMGWGALEMVAAKRWKRLDKHLRWLAVQKAAGSIGCSWCMDYGYYEGMQQGVDPRKVRAVARWRESDLYDDRERTVLEYAEAATSTPVEITDDLNRRLHSYFDDRQLVELAGWVALENLRSRFNGGLGLHSEGFAEQCEIRPEGVG